MRRRSLPYTDIHTSSRLLTFDLAPGEIYMLEKYMHHKVVFVYKDENSKLWLITDTGLKPFDRVYNIAHKYIKLHCNYQYIQNILASNTGCLEKGYLFSYLGGLKDVIELNGQMLNPYDYIDVLNEKDYTFDMGLLIGKNIVLLPNGKKTKFRFCKKFDKQEVERLYPEKIKALSALYKSITQTEIKKDIREFHFGDVYKKGDFISICLGVTSIDFHINYEVLQEARIPIQPVNTISYYRNENNKMLWFRFKMSGDGRIRKPVLDLLEKGIAEIGDFGVYILLLSNMGNLKLSIKNGVYNFVTFDTLKYDIRDSMLGSYIGHFDITPKLFDKSFGFKLYNCTDDVKTIRRNVRLTFRLNEGY